MTVASCMPAVKAYLVDTVLPGLFPPPTLITWGMPGTFEPADIVTVGNARVVPGVVALTPARPVEETLELEVLFSCYRPGGPEAQRTATVDAFAMLSTLRDYFKTAGNETLGGSCRTARVTAYELAEDDDPEDVANGRLSQVTAVITIRARN